jgi:hypothetical protein
MEAIGINKTSLVPERFSSPLYEDRINTHCLLIGIGFPEIYDEVKQ